VIGMQNLNNTIIYTSTLLGNQCVVDIDNSLLSESIKVIERAVRYLTEVDNNIAAVANLFSTGDLSEIFGWVPGVAAGNILPWDPFIVETGGAVNAGRYYQADGATDSTHKISMMGLVMGMLFWDEHTSKFAVNPLFSSFLTLGNNGLGLVSELDRARAIMNKNYDLLVPADGIYEKDANMGALNVFGWFVGQPVL